MAYTFHFTLRLGGGKVRHTFFASATSLDRFRERKEERRDEGLKGGRREGGL